MNGCDCAKVILIEKNVFLPFAESGRYLREEAGSS